MNFYAPQTTYADIQQGDLLEGIPFAVITIENASVLLAKEEKTVVRNLFRESENIEHIMAKAEYRWGMVLSQTCDVQPDVQTGLTRRPILIARVKPFTTLYPKAKFDTTKNSVKSVNEIATPSRSPSSLYLPSFDTDGIAFERSVVNLLDVQGFSPSKPSLFIEKVRLRLSPPALQALQERCAYCFGRFGAPDDLYYSAEEWAELERQAEDKAAKTRAAAETP